MSRLLLYSRENRKSISIVLALKISKHSLKNNKSQFHLNCPMNLSHIFIKLPPRSPIKAKLKVSHRIRKAKRLYRFLLKIMMEYSIKTPGENIKERTKLVKLEMRSLLTKIEKKTRQLMKNKKLAKGKTLFLTTRFRCILSRRVITNINMRRS